MYKDQNLVGLYGKSLIKKYIEKTGDKKLERFNDLCYGKFVGDLEFIQEVVELPDDVEFLFLYIDWENIAKDMMNDLYFEIDGYYFDR